MIKYNKYNSIKYKMTTEIEVKHSEFVSYKKVLLFGAESTGKSSLSKRLEKGKFIEDIANTEDG